MRPSLSPLSVQRVHAGTTGLPQAWKRGRDHVEKEVLSEKDNAFGAESVLAPSLAGSHVAVGTAFGLGCNCEHSMLRLPGVL